MQKGERERALFHSSCFSLLYYFMLYYLGNSNISSKLHVLCPESNWQKYPDHEPAEKGNTCISLDNKLFLINYSTINLTLLPCHNWRIVIERTHLKDAAGQY